MMRIFTSGATAYLQTLAEQRLGVRVLSLVIKNTGFHSHETEGIYVFLAPSLKA